MSRRLSASAASYLLMRKHYIFFICGTKNLFKAKEEKMFFAVGRNENVQEEN